MGEPDLGNALGMVIWMMTARNVNVDDSLAIWSGRSLTTMVGQEDAATYDFVVDSAEGAHWTANHTNQRTQYE